MPIAHPVEAARLNDAFSLALRFCIARHSSRPIDLVLHEEPTTPAASHTTLSQTLSSRLTRPQAHADALSMLPGLRLLLSDRPKGRQRLHRGCPSPSSDADAHPLLLDSPSKAQYLAGLPFGFLSPHPRHDWRGGWSDGAARKPWLWHGGFESRNCYRRWCSWWCRARTVTCPDRRRPHHPLRLPMLSSPGFQLSSERIGAAEPLPPHVHHRLTTVTTCAPACRGA